MSSVRAKCNERSIRRSCLDFTDVNVSNSWNRRRKKSRWKRCSVYTFTRKIEKHFQRPSPKDRIIDSRPWCGKSASSRSRWETTDRWISKPWRISLSFRIEANSQQKIVHFGEQREPSNVNYIFVLRTVFRTKRTDTVELAWTDTREYSTLEDNLDFRRGQRISGELRSILSRWYAVATIAPYFINL